MPARVSVAFQNVLKIVFEARVMAFAIHNSVTFHAIAGFVVFFPLSGFVMPLEFYGRVATPSCRRDYGWKSLSILKLRKFPRCR